MPESTAVLFAAKVLTALSSPLGLTFACLLSSAVARWLGRGRLAASLTVTGVAVLWISATPVFAGWALGTLERQHPPQAIAALPAADVAIILGGALGQPVPPRTELDLSDASDRVLHAARLYKAGKVRHILVAAGNIPWHTSITTEAALIHELLVSWGVPSAAITIAGASRNTYENALEIAELRTQKPFATALLVTSASHMPRAMAVFRRAGIPVIAATTDIHVVYEANSNPLRWTPDVSALSMTSTALKEWIGYAGYRLRGYL